MRGFASWISLAISSLGVVFATNVLANPFLLTNETPIHFTVDESFLTGAALSNLSSEDHFSNLRSASELNRPTGFTRYALVLKLENRSSVHRKIAMENHPWMGDKRITVTREGIDQLILNQPVDYHNYLSALDPKKVPVHAKKSFNKSFDLPSGESVELLIEFTTKTGVLLPATYAMSFYHVDSYSEQRRFGLWLEGILVGALLALTVFSWYSFYQSRDITSFYYGMWILTALGAVLTQWYHDGSRLFEFIFNVENKALTDQHNAGMGLRIIFSYSQAMVYVVFARSFLEIKKYFPIIYKVTNLYLLWYFGHMLSWIFIQHEIPTKIYMFPLFTSTFLMLLVIYYAAFRRLIDGLDIAKFFMIAMFPYLFFRTIFLFGLVGLPSPFSFLPEGGVSAFLNSGSVSQALGLVLEAMIMALAVIARTRWLQDQLAKNIQSQKELVENQNKVLEATVAERTQELKEQHQELDEAHQIVVGSLNYASRLQKGQLPRTHRLVGRFRSFDSIWEPRDTIGGDLWWVSSTRSSGPYAIAVADCTGHGVPGAILSLLVSNSLERIYANNGDENPKDALLSLDYLVRTGLNQDTAESESDDGCDAAIVRIKPEEKILEYAGAKIDLFHLKLDGSVRRYEPTRISLGYQEKLTVTPKLHEINYETGEGFVIVTDGFTDQIGGDRVNYSYGYRRLIKVLEKVGDAEAKEITKSLGNDLKKWQGNQKRRDDVTVIAFRV